MELQVSVIVYLIDAKFILYVLHVQKQQLGAVS